MLAGLLLSSAIALAQSNPFAPSVRSEFELNAFREIQEESDPAERLAMTEAFMVRYPESELRHLVLRLRWQAFVSIGDFAAVAGIAETALREETAFFEKRLASLSNPEALPEFARARLDHLRIRVAYYESLMEAGYRQGRDRDAVRFGEMGLAAEEEFWAGVAGGADPDGQGDRDAWERHRSTEGFFLRTLMVAHQNLRNAEAVIDYGLRALEVAPDDPFVLTTLAATMAERLPDGARREEQIARAEAYAVDALRVLGEPDAGAGLAGPLGSPELADLRVEAQIALGLVRFLEGRFGEAEEQYLAALDSRGPDALIYYRLGVARANDQNPEDAIDALAKAVYLGYRGAEARDALVRVYEAVHGSLEGIDERIDDAGAGLRAN